MILLWKIRYLDRTDKRFKDRELYLRTEALDPASRAAVELITEGKAPEDQRQILQFKYLFEEKPLDEKDLEAKVNAGRDEVRKNVEALLQEIGAAIEKAGAEGNNEMLRERIRELGAYLDRLQILWCT